MSDYTRLSRTAVKRRLRDLLTGASELAGLDLEVNYGPPRVPVQELAVYFADTRGTLEVANMRAGRQVYDDRFSVELVAVCFRPGEPDHELVDQAVEDLVEAVRAVVADRPTLALEVDGSGLEGIVSATVADLDGPTPWRTADGAGAAMRLVVAVHARISAP